MVSHHDKQHLWTVPHQPSATWGSLTLSVRGGSTTPLNFEESHYAACLLVSRVTVLPAFAACVRFDSAMAETGAGLGSPGA